MGNFWFHNERHLSKGHIKDTFKYGNDNNTILVKSNPKKGIEEKFKFMCHNHSWRWNQRQQPYHIFRRSDMQKDLLDFSANPFSVDCFDACKVTVIDVILDATLFCNESNTMDWECGLEELKRNFSSKLNIFKNSTRTYSIRNPVDNQHLWLPCYETDTKDSFYGIKSCLSILHRLNFTSGQTPIVIFIKMILKEELDSSFITDSGLDVALLKQDSFRIKKYYFTKLYWPPGIQTKTKDDQIPSLRIWDVIMSKVYAYPPFFTILTVIYIVIVLLVCLVVVVCHWCDVMKTYYKSKVKGGKVEFQDVCPIDGRDLVAKENLEMSVQSFPAGLNIDYSNLVIRGEIGEGNFGKVYQGYFQMNDVQRYFEQYNVIA